MQKAVIRDLLAQGLLSAIDVHFAKFISGFGPDKDADIFLAAVLVSRATAGGDICLDLTTVAGKPMLDDHNGSFPTVCPQLDVWLEKLKSSPAVGRPGDKRPLILDAYHRLYLYRYWDYERFISNSIERRIRKPINDLDDQQLKNILNRLFARTDPQEVDWQKIAAAVASLRHFSVITGGPGTGKTFTVTKVLALLLELMAGQRLHIYLSAPTGKAAARLKTTLEQARAYLDCADDVKSGIPTEVYTIHRMLKPIKGSPYFYHNRDNPLLADVVVVDEASMVDLALMAKLLYAVPEKARLILIGDKDQLASVEPGSVLGDICDRDVMHGFSASLIKRLQKVTAEDIQTHVQATGAESGLQDSIVVLHKSYRFAAGSGIGALSQAVNRGDADAAMDILTDASEKSLSWQHLKADVQVMQALSEQIVTACQPHLETHDPDEALRRLEGFKILCTLNVGPLGVQAINRLAEQVLSRQNLIQPDPTGANPWYAGRPVLITRNHYPLGLFNGDIGITLPSTPAARQGWVVYFRKEDGGLRRFLPQQLPEHDTVYAMTVHKSQGSEFDNVLFILPDKDVSVLTRELVYTALTRARRNITIWGTPAILRSALTRKIQRTSGLRDALWGVRTQKTEDHPSP